MSSGLKKVIRVTTDIKFIRVIRIIEVTRDISDIRIIRAFMINTVIGIARFITFTGY